MIRWKCLPPQPPKFSKKRHQNIVANIFLHFLGRLYLFAIATETLKCFEEAICSKDHARGPEVLAAWSTQEQNKSAS